MASASMKLPMNRKMIGSANEASARRAVATWKTTASAGPSSAVTAIGSASLTQSTTTAAITAARRCPASESPDIGSSRTSSSVAGARKRPAVRRRRLKRSSAGE